MKSDAKRKEAQTGKRPINFAVIGCGMFARAQHIPNIVNSPKAHLTACCAATQATLDLCLREYHPDKVSTDWREVVRDPDVEAICLSTTEKLRIPIIEAAAELGKPVYCEKPIAREIVEMYRIRDIVHQSGIKFCVGHNRRGSPAMNEAHRIWSRHMANPQPCPWRFDREGELRPRLAEDGTPSISVRINDDWYSWKAWVFDKEQAPHGLLLFETTHFTDVCNWFMNDQAVEVCAMESGMLNHSFTIRYRNGGLATIAIGSNGTFGYPKELYECMGHGGYLAIDHMVELRTAGIMGAPERLTFPMVNDRHPQLGQEGGISGWLAKRRANCADALRAGDNSLVVGAEADKGHLQMVEAFVDEIRGERGEVCGVDRTIEATRIAFAAVLSANQHRFVAIDEV